MATESKVSQGAVLLGGAVAAVAIAYAATKRTGSRADKEEKTGWDDKSLMLMAPKEELDISFIRPGLYQGSLPPTGRKLKDAGIDVVVLGTGGYQPPREEFEGVKVIRSPLKDSERLGQESIDLAVKTSKRMARAIKKGKTVLSSCRAGLNRSSLLSALTMLRLGETPEGAVAKIRAARGPHALTHGGSALFLKLIESRYGIDDKDKDEDEED